MSYIVFFDIFGFISMCTFDWLHIHLNWQAFWIPMNYTIFHLLHLCKSFSIWIYWCGAKERISRVIVIVTIVRQIKMNNCNDFLCEIQKEKKHCKNWSQCQLHWSKVVKVRRYFFIRIYPNDNQLIVNKWSDNLKQFDMNGMKFNFDLQYIL